MRTTILRAVVKTLTDTFTHFEGGDVDPAFALSVANVLMSGEDKRRRNRKKHFTERYAFA